MGAGRLGRGRDAESGAGLGESRGVDSPAGVAEALGQLEDLVGLGKVGQPVEGGVVGRVGGVRRAGRPACEEAVDASVRGL